VRVSLNGQIVTDLALHWNPTRVGAYDFTLPQALVRRGINRLSLTALGPSGGASERPPVTFGFWYVRVRPSVIRVASNPMMALDALTGDGAFRAGDHFAITGWAIDRSSTTGVGVSDVRAYAYRVETAGLGPPLALGSATVGLARPDLAAVLGEAFAKAGFSLDLSGLRPGQYRVAVFVRSAVSTTFNQWRIVDVSVSDR
jgi:hypothetical protein